MLVCKKKMLFSKFCHLSRLVFDQSSPVKQNPGLGTLRVTEEKDGAGNPRV